MRGWRPRLRAADGGARSALFEYLNAFKRSAVLGDAERAALEATADVVFDHVDGDLDRVHAAVERVRSANPRCVYVALSGFGLTGPYAAYRTNAFLDFATGGHTAIGGHADREPLAAGLPWAGYLHGLTAAIGAFAALRRARETGEGQLVDVGAMESLAGTHQWSIVMWTHYGVVKRRAGNRHAESMHPMGLLQVKDGWVGFAVAFTAQWEGLCLALDRPELLADPRFETGGDRYDNADALDGLLRPALMSMTAEEVVRRAQEFRVPAGPLLTLGEVLDLDHFAQRGFFATMPHLGPGARMPVRAVSLPHADAPFTPAPAIGADTAAVLAALGASV
jgi:CoA:oxalate CoA-transferase